MLIAALFVSAFVFGFGYLTAHSLRSGKLRGMGWFVAKAEAPFRYWAGTFAYGFSALAAAAFLMLFVALLFVR